MNLTSACMQKPFRTPKPEAERGLAGKLSTANRKIIESPDGSIIRLMSDQQYVTVTRIFSGDDGQSHFEDLRLPVHENTAHPCPTIAGRSIGFTAQLPAEDVSFRVTPPGGDHPFHWSPGRALQFTLSGLLELTVGDGTVRRFGPGDVLLLDEQARGQGHMSREIQPRLTVNVHLPVDLELPFVRDEDAA
jgi:hypothetical protein